MQFKESAHCKKAAVLFKSDFDFKNEDLHFDEEDDADHFEFTAPEAQILIVDDNAINLTVTEGLLKPLGMQIDTCLSGKEAIEKFRHRCMTLFLWII